MYTINDFWIPTLGHASAHLPARTLPAGWTTDIDSLSTFVEAPIEMAGDFGQQIPYPILLVSAPGAVGKSTLAREIAARTGAVLVDLAQAEAVGSSTVSGGLAWADMFNGFRRGDVALMIDGLDEARMQVTEASFAAFLEDVRKLARADGKPITLFGRTSAVEEAWLHFAETGFEPPVLEIQFHGHESALDFVVRRIASARTEQGENVEAAADADRKAARHILDSLEQQAEVDGDRFVGYAPVLIAVSKRVAAERNPMALAQGFEREAEVLSLNDIVDAILERERTKLEPLGFTDPALKGRLYGKDEQVERLISAVYGVDHVPNLPAMSPQDAETYKGALDSWVPDHPFTDGSGKRPSSEVFGGFIAAEALKKKWAAESVRNRELGSAKVNPFIWRFRLPACWLKSEDREPEGTPDSLPLVDLGLVFASLQARLSRSESAHLLIDADRDLDCTGGGNAEVEIIRHFGGETRWLRLSADCDGAVYFGSRINDVNISGSELSVVTSGTETTLVAPVELDVGIFDAGRSPILVEGPRRGMDGTAAVVRLRCSAFKWNNDVLSVRPTVELAVDWPGSESFPWHSYRKPDVPDGIDAELGDCLRRLRKILMLFRARGKGQLAKFKGAIDHERRSRGSGAAVRDRLLKEGVLLEEGRFYVLDTSKLGRIVGLTFLEIRSATVNERTMEFLRRV